MAHYSEPDQSVPEHPSKVQFKANPLFLLIGPVAYFGAAIYLRSLSGAHVFGHVRRDSQCLFFRGDRANGIVNYLECAAPGMACNLSYTKRPEIIVTVGMDCQGKPVP